MRKNSPPADSLRWARRLKRSCCQLLLWSMLSLPRFFKWSVRPCNTTSLMGEVNHLDCLFGIRSIWDSISSLTPTFAELPPYGILLIFLRYPRDRFLYLATQRFRRDLLARHSILHIQKAAPPSTRKGMNHLHSHFESFDILRALLNLACLPWSHLYAEGVYSGFIPTDYICFLAQVITEITSEVYTKLTRNSNCWFLIPKFPPPQHRLMTLESFKKNIFVFLSLKVT